MSDRPQLKYVRTDAGFATCPSATGQHVYLARAVKSTPISAGFIEWDFDGLPLCMGRSESLNLNSMACDTAALREAWGMRAPAARPALNPAALAAAQKFGKDLSDESLEVGDPA